MLTTIGRYARRVNVAKGRRQLAAAIDLDGILLDGMPYHIDAWKKAFAPYRVKLDTHFLYLLEGIKGRDVVERICNRFDLDITSADRDRIVAEKTRIYRAIFKPTPLNGAQELLQALVRGKCKTAIVTGTLRSSAVETLAKIGMPESVDLIISADLDIPGKPDPAPFRTAADQLKVRKDCCLAVDNAPAGIESAQAAGLPCVAVATYLPKSDLTAADLVLDNVKELAEWVDKESELSAEEGKWRLASTKEKHIA